MTATGAIRIVVRGDVWGVGFREATVRRAHELGVLGWVRHGEDGTLALHVEGVRAVFLAVRPAGGSFGPPHPIAPGDERSDVRGRGKGRAGPRRRVTSRAGGSLRRRRA